MRMSEIMFEEKVRTDYFNLTSFYFIVSTKVLEELTGKKYEDASTGTVCLEFYEDEIKYDKGHFCISPTKEIDGAMTDYDWSDIELSQDDVIQLLALANERRYPENIMKRCRQRLGLDEDDTSRDDEINLLSPKEAFEECLIWEGIIGYGDTILGWVEDIFEVKLDEDTSFDWNK